MNVESPAARLRMEEQLEPVTPLVADAGGGMVVTLHEIGMEFWLR